MLVLYFLNEKTDEFFLVSIQRGEKRGDVAQALGIPALENSGFTDTFKKHELKSGTYKLVLLHADHKNGVISCQAIYINSLSNDYIYKRKINASAIY